MPDLRSALERTTLRGLLRLPPTLVERLAGAPVVIDDNRLAPELQLLLKMQRLARVPEFGAGDLVAGRPEVVRQAGLVGHGQTIASVRDLSVDGAAGPLRARLYRPVRGGGPLPTLLFLHGGGMAVGDIESHDQACRHLSRVSGVQVLSVDYRLAPEHTFPAAVDDCAAAFAWLVENAESLGADPERLAVGGDSAGGYLSATTAIIAAERGLPLALQLLIYPATVFVNRSGSRDRLGDGFFLTEKAMNAFTDAFFPNVEDRSASLASVLLRDDLPDGLAPAIVVTAGFDPLRDEGQAYADKLRGAGVSVEELFCPGMIHGFINMVDAGPEAASYNVRIAEMLREALAG